MKVWIGLALLEDCSGDEVCLQDEGRIKDIIKRSKCSADLIWTEWGEKDSFDGFYLSLEGWTPGNNGELGYLKNYLIEVSRYCSAKNDRLQVSTSPFINKFTSEESEITDKVYSSFLGETSLTVLMLQDGVGAKGVPLDVVTAYMKAMKKACDNAGIDMWANIESFADSSRKTATSFDSLQAQIAAAYEVTRNLVTFEFFKYWTNFLEIPGANDLNNDYFKAYISDESNG